MIDEITWNDLDMDRIFMLMMDCIVGRRRLSLCNASQTGIFRREIKGAGTAVLFF